MHLGLLARLARRARLVILAGAGVSVSAPSNLPGGRAFSAAVLRHILPRQYRAQILRFSDAQRRAKRTLGGYLRFEALLELLADSGLDPSLDVLVCYATASAPNYSHDFLSAALQAGHRVLTTNFDTLIEQSCVLAHAPVTQVVTVTDYRRAAAITPRCALIKLHGSTRISRDSGATWTDSRETLAATLTAIGKSQLTPSLNALRRKVLARLLRGCELVVLGYSGQDDFDVLPLITAATRGTRITWVTHSRIPTQYRNLTWRDLDNARRNRDRRIVNRHGVFVASRDAFLYAMGSYTKRCPSVEIIEINTERFLKATASALRLKLKRRPAPAAVGAALNDLRTWARNHRVSPIRGHYLAGMLLVSVGDLPRALTAFGRCRRIAPRGNDHGVRLEALYQLAGIRFKQREYSEAMRFYRAVQREARRMGESLAAAKASHQVALMTLDRGQVQEAERLLRTNLRYFSRSHDVARKGLTLYALAMCKSRTNHVEAARALYREAAVELRRGGDIKASAGVLHQLAVLNRKAGRYGLAKKGFERARRLSDALGYEMGVALSNWGLAQTAAHEGKTRLALRMYRGSLMVFERLGDTKNIADVLLDIGEAEAELGRKRHAESTLATGIRLAEGASMVAVAEDGRRRLASIRKSV